MTWSDVERRDVKGQTFPDDLCSYAPTVWLRATKFVVVHMYVSTHGEGHVSTCQTRPIFKGWGPSIPIIFWDPLTYAHMVWPRVSNFSTVTRVGVSRDEPRSKLGCVGPSVCKVFGTSYMHTHSMRNNQILHDDQTRREEKFYRSTFSRHECRHATCLQ